MVRVASGAGSKSPSTRISRSGRPKRSRMARPCAGSMTTMRSALRAALAVRSRERCGARSTPRRAAAPTASGGQGRLGPMNPADPTRTPAGARRPASSAAANGLRQILPWQITRTAAGAGRLRSAASARLRRSGCSSRSGAPRSRERKGGGGITRLPAATALIPFRSPPVYRRSLDSRIHLPSALASWSARAARASSCCDSMGVYRTLPTAS